MLKDKLKELRESKGYTKKELCEKTGISERAYLTYEFGEREPKISTVAKLADFYDVSIDFLVGREPAPDPFGEYNLTDATEDEVIEAFLALPPKIRACILDIMAQLGSVVESSRTPSDADSDEYEEITLGEIEDARNAEIQTYEKDAG